MEINLIKLICCCKGFLSPMKNRLLQRSYVRNYCCVYEIFSTEYVLVLSFALFRFLPETCKTGAALLLVNRITNQIKRNW